MPLEVKKTQQLITKLAKQGGVGVGDIIERLTRYFGIPQCSRCKRWQHILNRLRIIGWKITWEDIR